MTQSRTFRAALATLLFAAVTPAAGGAQVLSSFSCVGGSCDLVDLTFSFEDAPRSLTALTLNTGGFAGFVYQDDGFGGQLNDVSPPLIGGTPGRFFTGTIQSAGRVLATSSCASSDVNFPLCGPSDVAGDATVRVYFERTATLGTAADFAANAGYTLYTNDATGTALSPVSGTFSPTATIPEPGTVALVGLGLTGLAGVVRRRTRSATT